jgi:hypothetical protein
VVDQAPGGPGAKQDAGVEGVSGSEAGNGHDSGVFGGAEEPLGGVRLVGDHADVQGLQAEAAVVRVAHLK